MSRPNPFSPIPFNAWLLLIGVTLAVFWTHLFPTSVMRNLNAGREHAAVIQQLIEPDPRFSSIKLGVGTANGGVMIAHGTLASKADMDALMAIIQASHPPVLLSGHFEIGGQDHRIRLPADIATPRQ